ncbi:MAG: hypothetical protein NTV01_17140, partial [Bacteroidia bacterium]|nr:hypothetical protein [Bacteroidia bacterium]
MKNKQNGKAWSPCKYLVIACFFLTVGIAGQAQRTASVSGNWSNTATWGGAAVPTAAQTVTINNGITVTVDIAAACNTLTTVNTGTLTISGTNSLAVTGLITMARPASNNTNFTIAVGAGSLTAGSLTMSATTTTRNDIISISTGTLTISGAITTGTTGCQFIFTGAGKMNIGGSFSNTPTLTTFSGSTVNYTALGVQTALATAYSNLTLSGSGVKTFATTPTVNGVLSMEGTATVTVTTGVVTYGTNATLQYNTATSRTVTSEEWISPFAATGGVIIANTGTITADGAKVFNASVPLIINSNATLATNNFQVTFGGNFVNDGMFTAGSSPIVIANTMAAQSIDGFTTTGTVSMTKTGGTATFAGNVNGGAFSLTGSGGILNLGTGLTHSGTTLTLAGAGQPSGSWGGPTSGATYINSTYFATATGVLNVSTSSCTTGSWLGTNS